MQHRHLHPRRPLLVVALLASLIASPGDRADAAEPIEVGAIAAGAVFLLGPEAKTDGFFYFTTFVDLSGDGKYTEGEPTREYRLDVKVRTFWSLSRYAAGRVAKEALEGKEFKSTFRDETIIKAVSTSTGASAKTGLIAPQEIMADADFVPVIVLSANPEPVVAALLQVSERIREEEELHKLVAAAANLKRTQEQIEALQGEERGLKSASKEAASLVARVTAFNRMIVLFKATTPAGGGTSTLAFLDESPIHGVLTKLQDAVTSNTTVQADAAKTAAEKKASTDALDAAKKAATAEYTKAMSALLGAAGIPTKGLSDAEIRLAAANYLAN